MINYILQQAADFAWAIWPQPVPDKTRWQQCKIISHRGEYDNETVFENTLPAFDRIMDYQVWGIELDVRWTKDLYPVVFHDRTTERLFNDKYQICDMSLSEIKKKYPIIPSLDEILSRYGKNLHLMIEIKEETYPDPEVQNRVLKDLFSPLTPKIDYHILSLQPEMFQLLNFAPPSSFLPVAELNVRELSRIAVEKQYGGITGHFMLLSNRYLKKHASNGQKVGTGFVRSKNCLYRELNRGIEWIFSNHATKLQILANEAIKNNVDSSSIDTTKRF